MLWMRSLYLKTLFYDEGFHPQFPALDDVRGAGPAFGTGFEEGVRVIFAQTLSAPGLARDDDQVSPGIFKNGSLHGSLQGKLQRLHNYPGELADLYLNLFYNSGCFLPGSGCGNIDNVHGNGKLMHIWQV